MHRSKVACGTLSLARMKQGELCKIVVLGGGGVGKSALTIRLVTDNFLEEYDPTIEDSYKKNITVDEQNVALEIVDTAGQEEYSSMLDEWMREGKGFLLVYSIIDQQTVDVVQELHRKILRATEDPSIPIVLIGNKCDMISGRQVSYETGEKLAASWNVPFMETSAKSKQNNVECFCQLVREIKRKEDQLRLTIQEAKEEKNSRCHCVLI